MSAAEMERAAHAATVALSEFDRAGVATVLQTVPALAQTLRELLAVVTAPTPPADDVREALAAARNVERYIDMLALDADDRVNVVIDDGYDGDGVIHSLEVPDLRSLIDFIRGVHPCGTVTDAASERAAILADLREWSRPLGSSPEEDTLRLVIARIEGRADREAAREVHP